MRILFALHTFPPESWGGTELHVQSLGRLLAADHDIRVFCRSGDPRLPEGHVGHGFQEGLLVARFNNLFRDYDGFEWVFRNRAAHEAFVAEIESFRPDIVHVHHLTSLSSTIVAACKERDIPVVFTLHDFWTVCPRGQRLRPDLEICEDIDRRLCHTCLAGLWPDWFPADEMPGRKVVPGEPVPYSLAEFDRQMRETLKLCDVLVTPSEFHRAKMLEEVELDPRRIVAVPHGLDHTMFTGLHDPAPRPRVIGYIGSVIPPKGVNVLVEAFRRLDEEGVELRIHGDAPVFHETTDYLDELREQARGGGPVRFLGHYDNGALPRILSEIDILVVPSLWWETFSLTIREAMLAGVPVVASDIGAMKEALETSRAGLSFRVGDADDLARVLRRLIRDRKLRTRFANRRLEVKTLQRNASEYLELYEKARTISMKRKGKIEVKPQSFPQKKQKAAPADPSRDLKVSIEKIGGGDVRVESAVERADRTRVTFTFDYGPSTEHNEVRLTVDFSNTDEAAAPAAEPAKAAPAAEPEPVVPAEAVFGVEEMVTSQDPERLAEQNEREMYRLDEKTFPEHVAKLDEVLEGAHLEEDDEPETPAPRRKPARRPSGDVDEESRPRRERRGGREREEAGRERSSRDGRPPRRERDRDRGARGDRSREGDRDRNRERGRERDRRPERDGERQRDRGRGRERDGGDRGRDDRTEARPTPKRKPEPAPREPKPGPKPGPKRETGRRPAAADAGSGVVWNTSSDWKLPEESAPEVSQAPKRAPNHRTGAQPGVSSRPAGDFGEGLPGES